MKDLSSDLFYNFEQGHQTGEFSELTTCLNVNKICIEVPTATKSWPEVYALNFLDNCYWYDCIFWQLAEMSHIDTQKYILGKTMREMRRKNAVGLDAQSVMQGAPKMHD